MGRLPGSGGARSAESAVNAGGAPLIRSSTGTITSHLARALAGGAGGALRLSSSSTAASAIIATAAQRTSGRVAGRT